MNGKKNKEQAMTYFKILGRTKKVIKSGKISVKHDILTAQEKGISLIGKEKQIRREMSLNK